MVDFLSRAFAYLYPSKPQSANNSQADTMRTVMLYCIVLHVLFFMVSLAFIGFLSML